MTRVTNEESVRIAGPQFLLGFHSGHLRIVPLSFVQDRILTLTFGEAELYYQSHFSALVPYAVISMFAILLYRYLFFQNVKFITTSIAEKARFLGEVINFSPNDVSEGQTTYFRIRNNFHVTLMKPSLALATSTKDGAVIAITVNTLKFDPVIKVQINFGRIFGCKILRNDALQSNQFVAMIVFSYKRFCGFRQKKKKKKVTK